MNPDRLTLKANQAVQRSAALATEHGNPVINDAHLFVALLDQDEGIVVPILQKAGVNVVDLSANAERELNRLPSQEGGAVQPTFAREYTQALAKADDLAKGLGDAYVSTEHLLDRKSTRLNSSHTDISRMPSSA